MVGTGVVIDTSIIIHYLRARPPEREATVLHWETILIAAQQRNKVDRQMLEGQQ